MRTEDVVPRGTTIRQMVVDRALAMPDRPFVHFGDEVATYGRVHERAVGYAGALAELGVGPGELVAQMMANSVDYVQIYLGLAYRGAAVVLVNTAFRGYMLEYLLNDAGCRVLVADEEMLEVVVESEDRLGSLELVVVTGDRPDVGRWAGRFSRVKLVALADVRPQGGADPLDVPVSPTDLHCVVYSSGTTGPSKGIMISGAHALVKAVEVLRICGFGEDDVLYSPLPLFYSMGLLRGVLSVALVGSSIVLRDRFSASAYWDDVRAHGATVGHTVFSLPRMLKSAPPTDRDRDHSLRCMFNAQHDPEFEERFGVRLIEGYGLTEAGNALYNRLDEPTRPGSCGRVSDEWEVRLGADDGEEVPVGETGEILLRARDPHRVMLGYLNKPEATVAATRDLWLHTGDLARRDEEGFHYYVGRSKDVIRRRGQNISGWEVEQMLLEHPDVAEAAALAHPSEIGEDDLRVVLVAEAGVELDLAAVAEYCERRMPEYMVPRYLEMRPDLPKTPSGRVEKYRLADAGLGEALLDRGSGRRR